MKENALYMWSTLERVLLAGFISASSFCFSYYWYVSGKKVLQRDEKAVPIAFLMTASQEVQRKPSSRVIWETVKEGDQLYANEAIRTALESDAEIKFLESDTTIILEPDSLVVLQETGSDLTLDFLKGNVVVNSDSNDENLKIKSGNNTIAVGDGQLALNKNKGGQLDLQVLRGQASVDANGKSLSIGKNEGGVLSGEGVSVEKNEIQILSPLSSQKLFLNFEQKEKFVATWKPLSEDYRVRLLRGKSRTNLREVQASVLTSQGRVEANWPVGRYYWRLEAISKNSADPVLKSPVMRNQIFALLKPEFLSPSDGELIVLEDDDLNINFRWSDRLRLKDVSLQYWRIENGQVVGERVVEKAAGQTATVIFEDEGSFQAQVVGSLEKSETEVVKVVSDPVSFTVKIGQPLVPPQLIYPEPNQKLRFTQVIKSGLFLTWKSLKGMSYKIRYETRVEGEPIAFDEDLKDTTFRIDEFEPGYYTWSVASVNADGEVSEYSAKRRFLVGEMPRVAWKDGRPARTYLYTTPQPSLLLEWLPISEASSYQVRVGPPDLFEFNDDWQTVAESEFLQDLEKEGIYSAQVRALGPADQVIARSSIKKFKVQMRKLLPAPKYVKALPLQVKANIRGDAIIAWNKVRNASEYVVYLKDKDGKEVDFLTRKIDHMFKGLKPGNYQFSVRSKDEFERIGLEGEWRQLEVLNASNIRAPAFKKVKIKKKKRARR